jgi:hypothetical protein
MEKQHINILVEPTIYRIKDDQANNYTITMAKINTLRQQWLFQFPIVNFLFTCINIPTAPIYGTYIPQLIQFSKACFSCHDFLDKKILLTRKTLLCWSFCCQFSNLRRLVTSLITPMISSNKPFCVMKVPTWSLMHRNKGTKYATQKHNYWMICMNKPLLTPESTCIHPRFSDGICVAYLFIFLFCVDFFSLFCFSSSCIWCVKFCQCLCIVHSWFPLSLMFICSVHLY